MLMRQKHDWYETLNDPALLDDTPIGTLRVIPWANAACVALMDKHDPTIPRAIIKTLCVGQNPLDAIYGKRTHEHRAWREAYGARDEAVAKSAASEAADLSKDFVRELDKLEARKDDGAEAVAAALGVVPWDVAN